MYRTQDLENQVETMDNTENGSLGIMFSPKKRFPYYLGHKLGNSIQFSVLEKTFITARKWSYRKIMFLHVFVCPPPTPHPEPFLYNCLIKIQFYHNVYYNYQEIK